MGEGITIIRRPQVIQVKSAFPIFPKFQNFSFIVGTNGQTEFTLPSNPVLTGLIVVNTDGITQDPLNGDYTVVGNTLIMNPSLLAGQKVAGFYQVQSPSNVPPLNLGYATFFTVAIQGQTQFNIGFLPQAIIYVSVNGTLQAVGDGDYTINGQIITMSQGLNYGDKFFGLAVL